MANAFDEAVRRMNLSSSNQMEMLTFRLTDNQLYGINVFKIIEILECPSVIDRMPNAHPAVKGAIDFRGNAVAVIDLSEAVGLPAKDFNKELAYLVICEYSMRLTAFVIHAPDNLLTRSWSDIHKPEGVSARSLVAIAYSDGGETIMLLDIESILAEIVGIDLNVSEGVAGPESERREGCQVVVGDDSKAAIGMLQSVLARLGIENRAFSSAAPALEYLHSVSVAERPRLLISDIEMPGMDGFTFTRQLREHPELKELKIMLHSSMSNPSNRLMAEQAGADLFVAKFDPDNLAEHILQMIADK
ncbi:MAG TPA: chemotaxis protein [Deltaproteobacteria bacterium]|nr:chemotaxis protein [Deltaproteobacteria bacterium]